MRGEAASMVVGMSKEKAGEKLAAELKKAEKAKSEKWLCEKVTAEKYTAGLQKKSRDAKKTKINWH